MTRTSQGPGTYFLYVFALAVLLFEIFPLLVLIPFAFNSAEYLSFPPEGLSLRWFNSFFTNPSWANAAVQSLRVATLTTLVSVVVGTAAAFAVVRQRVRFGRSISVFLLFPMIGPHIAFAIAIFGVFSRVGIAGTTFGLVLAHSIVATPFVYINVASRLATFDWRLEHAAQSLGASQFKSFLFVTAPIIAPAILAGGVFAFLSSWDEFIITFFTADVATQTLPLRIFSGIEYGVDVTAAAASSLVLFTLILGVVLYRATDLWMNRDANAASRKVVTAGDVRL